MISGHDEIDLDWFEIWIESDRAGSLCGSAVAVVVAVAVAVVVAAAVIVQSAVVTFLNCERQKPSW